MKNYVVTLLLSLLVVLVSVTLRRSVTKAAQTKTLSPIVDLAPAANNLIPVGIGPVPCPPSCPVR